VTWTSGTTSVATINAAGLATGVSAGSSNITATLGSVTSPAAVLTVTKTLQSVAVTPATASIAVGAVQQFTATGTYSDGSTANLTTSVTWTSGTTSVATINAAGLATGVSTGSSNITATLGSVTAQAAVLTVTTAGGEPAIAITLLDQAAPGSSFYVDLQVTNTGSGVANGVSINQMSFRILGGSGSVTVASPALPIAVGTLNAGASTTVRVYVNVAGTVSRFAIGETGTVLDGSGTTFSFGSSEVVVY